MSDRKPAPRDIIIRAAPPIQWRATTNSDGGDGAPTLFGHFARFDEWTEIDSLWEGRFMERVARGAFKKTLNEGRDKIRLLFQHGMDPEVGDKPIGAIKDVREDEQGAYYEASLFSGLPELVSSGLRAGQYGASFRFKVVRESWNDAPDPSDYNPRGLPERTLRETQVSEFGPVTFGAYDGASAAMRSLTDDFIMRAFAQDPERLRAMFERAHTLDDRPVQVTVPTDIADEESVEEQQDPAAEEATPAEAEEAPSAPSDGDAGREAHLADAERRDAPDRGSQPTAGSYLLQRAGKTRERPPWHQRERFPR